MAKNVWAKPYKNRHGRAMLDVKIDYGLASRIAVSGDREAIGEVLAEIVTVVERTEANPEPEADE